MFIENEFIRDSNRRLKNLPLDKRKIVHERAYADLKDLGIFDPLVCPDDDIFYEDNDYIDIDTRIRQQQMAYGIEPDDEVIASNEEKQLIKHRHGKTDLHRAVEMGNIEEAQRLIKEGWNPLAEDNNGHNCITIASLEENIPMLEMFRDEGLIEEEGSEDYGSVVG